MRVLILSKDPTLFSGGDDTFGDTRKRHVSYANALRRRRPGSQVRVITYTTSSGRHRFEEVDEGLTIFGTGSRHRATYLAGVAKRLPAVLRDGWRPDVITAQTPWEEGSLGLNLARALKARFVAQLHFDLFSDQWVRESIVNPLRRAFASRTLRRAHMVRVVSTVLRDRVISNLNVDQRRVCVVPVGVNFEPVEGSRAHFKREIAPELENRKTVLFVGRLCRQKNLRLFVDVAERVVARRADAAFLIVGSGPEGGAMREWANKRGLSENFHFLGRQGHERLPAIYAAADAFLLTSHYEGFGRVIAEAYLSTVPVVSTRCTGPEDLIEDGVTGFLRAPGDSEGLAGAVLHLLDDDKAREQFGMLGREFVASRFSAERLCEELIDCWERAWSSR